MGTKTTVDDFIDSRITIHDSRHFEIKLEIDLPDSRSSTYEVESYFFVPKSLNIGPGNYSKHDFYSGIHKYIRFKTPRVPMGRITSPDPATTPWNKLKVCLDLLRQVSQDTTEELRNNKSGHEVLIRETVEELKLLGQVIRASLRNTTVALIERLHGPHLQQTEADIRLFLEEVKMLGAAIFDLKQEITHPQVSKKVKDAFLFFDEFYSLSVEEHFSLLYKSLCEEIKVEDLDPGVRQGIEEILVEQQDHRADMHYPSLIHKDTDNSNLPYRKGVLKKFTSSSLHLNLEQTEWQFLAQLNFSIAAGLAMLFAAVVTIFAQNRFSSSSSMFVMVVVVSYILKDRMKDWFKVILAKRMLRGVADYKTKIRDPGTDKVVGVFREAFAFIEPEKIPETVRHRRNIDNITSIDEEGKPERVMKYEKQVTLFPKKISKFHQRRRDINDIMRFDISLWVKHADDPITHALHFDRETRTLQTVPCTKVYHVNIVFRYQSLGADGKIHDTLERIRLILNHNGIVHLEEVRI